MSKRYAKSHVKPNQPQKRIAYPKNDAQKAYLAEIETHDLTFGIGPAGTGKTFLAVAAAVKALLDHSVEKIVLVRPIVEAGERLGFLPGSLQEKVDPYMIPLYDALRSMLDDRLERYMEKNIIEAVPLAFMRGRTLSNAFVILDEAQNTTPEQMKMFLTRMGNGSKFVVTGDTSQTDLPAGKTSGLAEFLGKMGEIEEVSVFEFADCDVVRHPLVQKILRVYQKD